MPFSKSFPKTIDGSNYTKWEEVFLAEHEEKDAEKTARTENVVLLKECIKDAQSLMKDVGLKDYQTDMIHIAIALFEKRASHIVYHKEKIAKEKFDKKS